ncbi:SDR family NAD(P)-dependent oxidoreductase [Marinomonas mediterranea]|jgi:Short-chain dehydrogenases of various substrate specificities|uniref:Short-chain dehydrogenase/reductase SDR n=1 Tax=Marinomonas mediterranea (strain ATCC 700492 / JCM 21426 / NBRC 103028 / MMB-1) TaxID=717774 RepID=F2JZI8_MARM1|nr:SDR family NAD(P)-dependent oxidoreductase [Marinomonas mediterranea]ADZ89771.1 short-chain dehydrogenase/reductase SDR [Marinomonas mediterranea MMB-1]WCN07861.1 SDR family NAD(P)-dependent oxidoreductase [Marinomonas mediterranea]WCN15994.1 SDR family NAD(P)-dependent oxidoreductase [Marinomonas mediterranea MMB-1]
MTTQYKGTVWITGASSGLGFSLVEKYLIKGWKVIASSRSKGALEPLLNSDDGLHSEQGALSFVAFDIANEQSVDAVRNALQQESATLDIAILNAGTCEYLDIDEPDWTMMSKMNHINYIGLVNSVEVCLPMLKKADNPLLVGVSSQAVNAAFPKAEAYGASKAAIRYFLSSLRMDLKQFNIDVSCILPGFVDTPLTKKNDFSMPFLMSSEVAANRILGALERRPFEYAFPKRLSVMLWLARAFPKTWLRLNATKPNPT